MIPPIRTMEIVPNPPHVYFITCKICEVVSAFIHDLRSDKRSPAPPFPSKTLQPLDSQPVKLNDDGRQTADYLTAEVDNLMKWYIIFT